MDRRDFFKLGISTSILSSLPLINSAHAGDDVAFDYEVSDYFSSLGAFETKELQELVKKYGTPLYVYDQKTIETKYKEFESAFKQNYSNVKIHYAFKRRAKTKSLSLDEELTVTQRHLDMSGVPMPNFTNIGSSLRRELNEEDDGDDNFTFSQKFEFSDIVNSRPYGVNTPDLIIEGEEESDSEQSQASEDLVTEEEGKIRANLLFCLVFNLS